MEFDAAPMDTGTRWLSAAMVVVVVGTTVFIVAVDEAGAIRWPAVVLNTAIIFFAWALAPRCYVLHGHHRLEVQRNAWRSFESQIDGSIELVNISTFGLRMFGSGGGFGWYGRFRRRDIGSYRLYATTRAAAQLVALQGAEHVIVISPADRQRFLDTLGAAR